MLNKKYTFFVDETGDHGLTFVDERFPLFLLAGCLIDDEARLVLEMQINELKQEIFNSTAVILHSRDIRKCEGSFQIFFDLALKQKFYASLNKIIQDTPFTIIGVGIDKAKHIERYGKNVSNPYMICLSYLLERLILCLDSMNSVNTVTIVVERRGKKEDAQLIAHYNSIFDRGTYHIESERFKKKIERFELLGKKANSVGLQLADLCAYPLARHLLNSAEPYIPFEIIKSKLYRRTDGNFNGYGLKLFP